VRAGPGSVSAGPCLFVCDQVRGFAVPAVNPVGLHVLVVYDRVLLAVGADDVAGCWLWVYPQQSGVAAADNGRTRDDGDIGPAVIPVIDRRPVSPNLSPYSRNSAGFPPA
jgi:hypothetical protein